MVHLAHVVDVTGLVGLAGRSRFVLVALRGRRRRRLRGEPLCPNGQQDGKQTCADVTPADKARGHSTHLFSLNIEST